MAGEHKAQSTHRGCRSTPCCSYVAEHVAGSMALEGLDLTNEDLQRIHQLAEDPTLEQSLLQELVKKHTNKE